MTFAAMGHILTEPRGGIVLRQGIMLLLQVKGGGWAWAVVGDPCSGGRRLAPQYLPAELSRLMRAETKDKRDNNLRFLNLRPHIGSPGDVRSATCVKGFQL